LVGCCSHVTRRHSRFIDEYEQGVDEIIAACRGDLRGTVKASMLISRAACYTDRLKLAIQSRLRTTLLSLPRPPIRRRIACRNLGPPERHQIAPLVWIPAHLRAILAAHVPLQLIDRCRLRPPHDVERDGLMGIAAEATGARHRACACSRRRRRACRLPCGPQPRARRPFGPRCRKACRGIWCP
jgi:hypothetical protein